MLRIATNRAAAIALLVLTGLVALFTAHLAFGFGSESFFVNFIANGITLGAAAVMLARGIVGPDERAAWLMLALAAALSAGGDLYYTIAFSDTDSVPFPNLSDGFYLAFFVPCYVAIFLLLKSRFGSLAPSMWLDGVVAGFAVAAVASALIFQTVVDATSGSTSAVVTNLAYPLADFVLLAVVVGALAATGWRLTRTWVFVLAGLTLYAVADSIYLYNTSLGTYVEGTTLDATWPAAAVLLAFAAWQPVERVDARIEGWVALVLPPAFALLGVAVLTFDHFKLVSGLAIVLACGALASVAVRLALTFRESVSAIAESRRAEQVQAALYRIAELASAAKDLQEFYRGIHAIVGELMFAKNFYIALYDEERQRLNWAYHVDEKDFDFPDPDVWEPFGTGQAKGLTRYALRTGEPHLLFDADVKELVDRGEIELVGVHTPDSSWLGVPLKSEGHVLGVLVVQSYSKEITYTEDDKELLSFVGQHVGAALSRLRAIEETRQRVAELATVNSVGQALASHLDLTALIELVGERVRETFDADIVYVALRDEDANRIDFAYYYEAGERREEPSLEYGKGLTSRILDSRETLVLNRSDEYDELASSRVGTPSLSYLGVPILVGDTAIGVLSVQSTREEGRFGEADAGLLATIAASVGAAIQNARLFEAQREAKQYFEALVEISPVAVVEMDTDELVTGWNPAAAELFGYTPDEVIGRHIDTIVVPEELRDESRQVKLDALEAGRTQRITRRQRRDGTLVDVAMMQVPLEVDGEHVGFYVIYHDITELQQAREEAEAATQAKSAFLATMSHEIRTPMNAVIGMTGLLLGTELTPEQREFAEVVRSSGDALLHVIDDILDYSKIEAGKLDLEQAPFDLRECVEGALDIVAPRAMEKDVELGCLFGESVPAGIVGDAARLRQVLLNLLSNAVKFTEKGEVVVHVDAQPAEQGSWRLELAVRDTGIGIPQDRMDRLFASFSQVDTSTTRRYGGTGLGLAISKRIVELMGGTIQVESEEGKGSTFRIALRAQEAEVPARITAEALPQIEGKRILVVDDNATNREIVTRQTRSWGMEPMAVELPSEALALLGTGEQFDLAVLDMMMPEMDGLELAEAIRQQRDERELPLVLLTSLGRLPEASSAKNFAAQLAKPIKASQLYNTLVNVLAEQATESPAPVAAVDGARAEILPLRILLAEDNAVNQKLALALLDRLGYSADVASNGREALEALERQTYDVVLMDIQMPELDGLEASRRICERWPADARPRIVAMTANAMPEDREACLAAGMDDYVAKPIRPEVLAEALRKVRPLAQAEQT